MPHPPPHSHLRTCREINLYSYVYFSKLGKILEDDLQWYCSITTTGNQIMRLLALHMVCQVFSHIPGVRLPLLSVEDNIIVGFYEFLQFSIKSLSISAPASFLLFSYSVILLLLSGIRGEDIFNTHSFN